MLFLPMLPLYFRKVVIFTTHLTYFFRKYNILTELSDILHIENVIFTSASAIISKIIIQHIFKNYYFHNASCIFFKSYCSYQSIEYRIITFSSASGIFLKIIIFTKCQIRKENFKNIGKEVAYSRHIRITEITKLLILEFYFLQYYFPPNQNHVLYFVHTYYTYIVY